MATLSIPIILRVTAPSAPPVPPPPPLSLQTYVAVDPPAAATVEFGAFTATIGLVRGHGTYADGMPYVDVVDGETCTLTAKTPPVETSGRIRHGFMLNPFQPSANQAFDSEDGGWKPFWTPAQLPEMSLPLEVGDMLLFGVAAETSANGPQPWRDGFLASQAWLHVRSGQAPAGAFSPPALWPAEEKRERPIGIVDIDAVAAWLPSLAVAGMTRPVTWAEVKPYVGRPNATFVASGGMDARGHEAWCARGASLLTGSNYPPYILAAHDLACMGLIGDTWSAADKREALIWLLQHGCQWAETRLRSGLYWMGAGSMRVHAFAPSALWWIASGQQRKLRWVYDRELKGNLPGQYFLWTSALISGATGPSVSGPLLARERTISSVTGNDIRVPFLSGEGTNFSTAGLQIVRVSDGASATVLSQGWLGENPFRVTINAQPDPAFAPSHAVYFRPSYTMTEGDPEWCIAGTDDMRPFSWSNATGYRPSTCAEPPVLFLSAIGCLPLVSTVPAMRAYVERVQAQDYPTSDAAVRHPRSVWQAQTLPLYGSNTDWANHWVSEMYDAHYASVSATADSRVSIPALVKTDADHLLEINASDVLRGERTGALATVVPSVGDPVGSVRNLGARGGWWTVPLADDRRPILRETGGKKWLEFDGTNDVLSYAVRTSYFRKGFHLFLAVAELDGNPLNSSVFSAAVENITSSNWVQTGFGDAANQYYWQQGQNQLQTGTNLSIAGAGLAPAAVVECRLREDRSMAFMVNGAVQASGTLGLHLNGETSHLILGSQFSNGNYAVFSKCALYGMAIIHSADLSDTEAATIRAAMTACLP